VPLDPRAVLTRAAPAPEATVRYGDGSENLADVRLPAAVGGPARPLVVVIHGGFWRAEYDRAHVAPLAADLAGRGYPVAQLEYRRTGQPGGGWPGTLGDVAAGVAALPGLVAEVMAGGGIRPGGTPELAPGAPILLGHSAGAQLALYCARNMPDRVGSVLALAPVSDLVEAYHLDLDGGAVAALLGGGPDEFPERYAASDPGRQLPLQTRTVLIHGALDQQVPVSMSRRYAAAAARAAGASCQLIELPDCEHFGLIDPESPFWSAVTAALLSLHQ
jgi:pimeloyl-ACP methyl ester carboxylesterase